MESFRLMMGQDTCGSSARALAFPVMEPKWQLTGSHRAGIQSGRAQLRRGPEGNSSSPLACLEISTLRRLLFAVSAESEADRHLDLDLRGHMEAESKKRFQYIIGMLLVLLFVRLVLIFYQRHESQKPAEKKIPIPAIWMTTSSRRKFILTISNRPRKSWWAKPFGSGQGTQSTTTPIQMQRTRQT